ncbi:hypothetical protein AB0C14_39005, partial [Microbispora hainanensis]|uniref:hypothetical protein n=1 Tax=Microbispora hainanensis TaxID=568844 RepID=UPI0033CFDC44
MDLFDIDPERLRRSNDSDGEWWDRLIANSPLWSSDGSSAREPFPIIGFEPPQPTGAPNAESMDAPRADVPGTNTDGADATRGEAASAHTADTDGFSAESGAGAARGAADGAESGAGASDVGGRGRGRTRSSWVLVGSVREVAQELALAPLPDDVDMCLAEAEELL